MITDGAGKILKTVNVSGSGRGTVNVDAATLSSGAYHYSLYINGTLTDTKQMILAK
jgi:trimeric autotransporter adhesin